MHSFDMKIHILSGATRTAPCADPAPVVATRPAAINLDNPATGAGGESGDDRRLGRRFARGHFSSALAGEAACDERRQLAHGGDGAEAAAIKVMCC